MSASALSFYGLAAIVLGGALLSVTTRNIFRAAIFLLFSLFGIAGIYLVMEYEFLAAVQTIVYVGGIVVLIIFSIFLTQQAGVDLPVPVAGRRRFATLAAVAGFFLVLMQMMAYPFRTATSAAASTEMKAIGQTLLSSGTDGYALPFEVVSILLLAAMIGSIVIALKPKSSVS